MRVPRVKEQTNVNDLMLKGMAILVSIIFSFCIYQFNEMHGSVKEHEKAIEQLEIELKLLKDDVEDHEKASNK